MENKNVILNETSIKEGEDLLNFSPYAEKIRKIIQGYADNPEPLTIGIYGKWGVGKTSLLNLIEKNIEVFKKEKEDKPFIKFHYNPWLYQTKEEMLFAFYEVLARKLYYKEKNKNLKKAGRFIREYSKYLKAIKVSTVVVDVSPDEFFKSLGEDLVGKKIGLEDLKNEIDDLLTKCVKKIIVFIDDVDRLDKDEIYTVLKLIKVNAAFKNMVFIICMDEEYVANAIYSRYGTDTKAGKEFLEKIINIPLHVPLAEKADLDHFLKTKLSIILNNKSIEEERVDELMNRLNGSFFSTPREIIRALNAFSIAYYTIGDEVNIHDLFWIEAIKVKSSSLYNRIKSYSIAFHSNLIIKDIITFNDIFPDKEEKDELFRRDPSNSTGRFVNKTGEIIHFLFPVKKDYKKDELVKESNKKLKINHTDHFDKYFSFHTEGKMSELKYKRFIHAVLHKESGDPIENFKSTFNGIPEHKILYKIREEIENLDPKDRNYEIFSFFLINNRNKLFSKVENRYGRSSQTELVQSIAGRLNSDNSEDYKTSALRIAEKLNYEQLSHFIGYINNKISYKEDLGKLLIEKVKNLKGHPFFLEYKSCNSMIMEVWMYYYNEEFQNYIKKHTNSKDKVTAFIRNFASRFTTSYTFISMFSFRNYDYLINTLKIDPEFIYNKIIEFYPEMKDFKMIKSPSKHWYDGEENSEYENLQQFVYWYKKDSDSNVS